MTKKYFHLIFYCLIFSLNQTTSAQYNFQTFDRRIKSGAGTGFVSDEDGGYFTMQRHCLMVPGADGFVKTDSAGIVELVEGIWNSSIWTILNLL